MEIVYSTKFNSNFENNKINNFYGDIQDLISVGIDINGIVYDDEVKVKKLLGNNKRVKDIFEFLDIDEVYLNYKICDLSKSLFKWILLAYVLIKKYEYIIFDYFDYGLIYKDKKRLVNIIKELSKDYNIIVVSKDLSFLSKFDNNIKLFNVDEIIEGDIIELITSNSRLFEIPDIINFIIKANKKGASLEYTLDRKELLKDIYRGVK